MLHELLVAPFAFAFMRRALAGCLALSVAGPPLGVFLVVRRMSLMSDVLQHGVLPGLALGALLAGFSLPAMGLGGFLAGLAVALLAGWLGRRPGARPDSQLAAVYLLALALGVALVSGGSGLDLTHLLFGSVLAVDDAALLLMAGVSTAALLGLAVIWRMLVVDSFDPEALGPAGEGWRAAFLALVVLCVVGGFAALGTLMSVGLMMLPAVTARHWAQRLPGQAVMAALIACLASTAGLLLAYHLDLPAGPAIVLTAGAIWLASLLAGPQASMVSGVVARRKSASGRVAAGQRAR
jgi:zinc/manganese transport system permease protein